MANVQKIGKFLRSMTFGLILLGLIVLISVAGSLIPQNNEVMYYVRTYPRAYEWILRLQLNEVFTSWYFALVVVLLCLNLTFCSIIRFTKIDTNAERKAAVKAAPEKYLTKEGARELKEELQRGHFRSEEAEGRTLFTRNAIGHYGTFRTHPGILLTVIFFALGMMLPKIMDQTCLPKESITLEDGTDIYVEDFSIVDAEGKLDYRSTIQITLPDGRTTGLSDLSVNHPVGLGSYKVYQQTYGTAGKVSVTDAEGHRDEFYVESQDFLSADGRTGILIDNLYPGFHQGENGLELVTSTSGRYENPVYVFVLMSPTSQEAMLAFPGDSIEAGGLTYTFEPPVEYPGLRMKKTPGFVNPLLLLSVLVLILGLAVTFLMTPVAVVVTEDGYRVLGKGAEGMRIMLHSRYGAKEIQPEPEKETEDAGAPEPTAPEGNDLPGKE